MAEPNLSLTFNALRKQVGFHLGFGRGESPDPAWDDRRQQTIQDVIDNACRTVYNESGHEWMWLVPEATLTIPAAATAVNLPDDFGTLARDISVGDGTSTLANRTLDTTNAAAVVFRQQTDPTRTGRPTLVAVAPLKDVSAGQRWQLLVYPKPDADYTVNFAYRILPSALSSEAIYHRGGELISGVILAACLMECELRVDRQAPGPFAAAYQQKLAAAIRADSANRPRFLGYNSDPRTGVGRRLTSGVDPVLLSNPADPAYIPL